MAPTFAILSLPHNECPADFDTNGWGNETEEYKTEQWQSRMQEVSNALYLRDYEMSKDNILPLEQKSCNFSSKMAFLACSQKSSQMFSIMASYTKWPL